MVFSLLAAEHVYRPSSDFLMFLSNKLPFSSCSVGGWVEPILVQLMVGTGSPSAWQLYTGELPDGSAAPRGRIVKLGGTKQHVIYVNDGSNNNTLALQTFNACIVNSMSLKPFAFISCVAVVQ